MSELSQEDLDNLGPLGPLAGVWEGDRGTDTAPSAERGTRVSKYREHLTLTPIGRVDNHEQILHGLSYATTAWRIGEDVSYHAEVGIWLWDAANRQVMRCFVVPRGITVLAGGTAEPGDKTFSMSAELGSPTYGICSNLFLHEEFRTVRYDLAITVNDDGSFSYEEDTVLKIRGREELYHHTDANTLRRVG